MKLTFKHGLFGLAIAAFAGVTLVSHDAEAARMGGGKSIGKQSTNVTQKQAPAAPKEAPKATPATPAPPAAAPAPARNKWLGPLAGIAAGLGIAALLSHFGMGAAMGEMLGSFLLIGALVLGALFLWRMWKNKNAPADSAGAAGAGGAFGQPAFAGAAPGSVFNGGNAGFDGNAFTPAAPLAGGAVATGAAAAVAGGGTWTIPAGFEVDDFLHIAKMYFVRLQAAWDTRNESDIRTFTTPEMYAEVKLDLVARGDAHNQTDVVTLNAEFLGVEEQGDKTLASVRLSGMIRETVGGPAEPFTEVWNLEKPAAARASWVLAGIQQE